MASCIGLVLAQLLNFTNSASYPNKQHSSLVLLKYGVDGFIVIESWEGSGTSLRIKIYIF